jgi:P4 family phage/plasmid primase-like protien
MEQILKEVGIDTSKNPTNCCFHSSVGGKCLGWNNETAHCFHCDGSWNKFSLIRDSKNLTDKSTFDWFAEKSGMIEELKQTRKNFIKESKAADIFTKSKQVEEFNKMQPLFFDKARLWWLWNNSLLCWQRVDDVDILNMIKDTTEEDIISSKNRTEILNALMQQGRRNIPKPIKPTWIQFKDEIIDIKTGEKFKTTPEYFVTNPIPYKLNKENFEETPVIDRIFEEWVGKEYVKTLYEIIAYCLLPDYPMHRLFCFVGAGMNGKSKFLELLRKFIGAKNCCSTELDVLINSRFEITRLHKKLVCQMGETNFNEMSKTSILKKLTGGDLIGFEYKNKDPFEEHNYCKIIIATNNLPSTTDKSDGFYRRWLIIDFPNQFSEKKDILVDIPEEEYESLALKSCIILKELLERRNFTKEGSIEDKKEKYEAKSNFLEKFIKDMTIENLNGYITKAEFYRNFGAWCKENRHREMSETSVGMNLKKLGYENSTKYFDWMNDGRGGNARIWLGLQWKN